MMKTCPAAIKIAVAVDKLELMTARSRPKNIPRSPNRYKKTNSSTKLPWTLKSYKSFVGAIVRIKTKVIIMDCVKACDVKISPTETPASSDRFQIPSFRSYSSVSDVRAATSNVNNLK